MLDDVASECNLSRLCWISVKELNSICQSGFTQVKAPEELRILLVEIVCQVFSGQFRGISPLQQMMSKVRRM